MGLLMALCPRLGRCAAGVRLRTFRSGLVLWAGAHLSLDGAWAQHMGAQSKKILVVSWRSGQEASTEDGGYTSLVLPRPLPGGTTRHAAAYHPCQPSPPGNVAAFSATPSGVPAAPQNTAAGGGRGQVPTPEPGRSGRFPSPTSCQTGGGQGAGRGRQALRALGLRGESPRGQCQPAPSPASFPTAHSVPGARALRGSPRSCPSPQIRADSPSLRCSGPHSSPAGPPAWEAPEMQRNGWGMDTWALTHLLPTVGPLVGNQVPFPSTLAPTSLIWSMVMLVASVWLGVPLGV